MYFFIMNAASCPRQYVNIMSALRLDILGFWSASLAGFMTWRANNAIAPTCRDALEHGDNVEAIQPMIVSVKHKADRFNAYIDCLLPADQHRSLTKTPGNLRPPQSDRIPENADNKKTHEAVRFIILAIL